MAQWPQHMDPTEGRICNRVLTAILAHPRNLFVRVFDGEEWATDWTRDRATIQRETAATDMTRWFLMSCTTPEGGAARRLGSILLIHGNAEDVISDASWNPREADAESIVNALCAVAEA